MKVADESANELWSIYAQIQDDENGPMYKEENELLGLTNAFASLRLYAKTNINLTRDPDPIL